MTHKIFNNTANSVQSLHSFDSAAMVICNCSAQWQIDTCVDYMINLKGWLESTKWANKREHSYRNCWICLLNVKQDPNLYSYIIIVHYLLTYAAKRLNLWIIMDFEGSQRNYDIKGYKLYNWLLLFSYIGGFRISYDENNCSYFFGIYGISILLIRFFKNLWECIRNIDTVLS